MNRIINYNGKLYILLREISKSFIDTRKKGTIEEVINMYKDAIKAEKILQNNDYYLLVNLVDDVEFEEILNN